MHKRNALQDRLYKRRAIWWVWGYDDRGVKWRESTRQTERKAAVAAARQIEVRKSIPPDKAAHEAYTLGEALDALDKHKTRLGVTAGTLRNTRRGARHLLRAWQRLVRLAELSLQRSESYMDSRLAEGAHRHTIALEFRVLTEALRLARDHGLYEGDPRKLIPHPLRKESDYYTPRDQWLQSAGHCDALIAATSSSRFRRRGPCRKLHVAAYLHTGVRKAELLRIMPEDVRLAEGRVWIRGTKTKGSARWVWLSDTAAEVFRRKLATARPNRPIFEPWGSADRNLKLAWQTARAKLIAAGEPESALPPRLSFNDLRRTFCSLMASAGVPMQHCAKLMGHESLDMVMVVYGRLAPESLASAVATLPALQLPAVSVLVHASLPAASLDASVERVAARKSAMK